MEAVVFLLFCAAVIGCVIADFSIVYALLFGFVLFCLYGKWQQHTWGQLLTMASSGIKTVKNILLTFVLIGMLTVLWRACGTIPLIVSCAASVIYPPLFLLMVFLLNCGISVLTGTALGTAATMGMICITISNTMGSSLLLTGGAALAGSYFGDRCSPVSTSALLISELTGTNLFKNIKSMYRTAWLPFVLACIIYAVLGAFSSHRAVSSQIPDLFRQSFHLHWLVLLPAAAVLLLSFFRVSVKKTMLVSIVLAFCLCLTVQKLPFSQILPAIFWGYQHKDPQLSSMLAGGGIYSMLRIGLIVLISSSYTGLFDGTGLLKPIKALVKKASRRITPFGAVFGCAILTSVIACNQALAIMMTHQFCAEEESACKLAIDLENTAVVIPPLIPWSVACAVPISVMGVSANCIPAACFLYLLPLCQMLFHLLRQKALLSFQA